MRHKKRLPFLIAVILLLSTIFFIKEFSQKNIVQAGTVNLILLWDDTVSDAPTDWTCISSGASDPFYQKFIRGNSVYGATGGATTHTHSAPTISWGTGAAAGTTGSNTTRPPLVSHVHTTTISSGLSGTNLNLPAYRNLKVIRYNYGIPDTLPAGVIAIFDAAPPAGWTEQNGSGGSQNYEDGRYIRGYDTANVRGTGGSNTHTHNLVFNNSSTAAASSTNRSTSSGGVAPTSHYHTITSYTTSPAINNEPGYMTVKLAKLDSNGSIPNGMIGMFDGTPPSIVWTVNSGPTQAFYQRVFKPTGTYGTSSDTVTHSHPGQSKATGTPTGGTALNAGSGSTYTTTTHTHTLTFGLDSQNHEPPYMEAIFAKRVAATTTFTQKSYRFENIGGNFAGPKDDSFQDQTDAADTARTDVKIGERLYLRINIEASASTSAQFRLQFGSGGTLPVTWADVTSSSAISYADGLLGELGDLEELGQNVYYPKTNATTTLNFSQGYFVRNGNTTPLIAMDRFSEVAFALDTTNATANTHYWFRLYNVTTGAYLGTYTQDPNLTVVTTASDQKKFSKNSLDAAPVNGD
ncbi:MAG: hypothetical protein MUO64_07440, partial [Anaerolineales bacterium]|nr:hypothetical protein [Anaerolineales bacterium]